MIVPRKALAEIQKLAADHDGDAYVWATSTHLFVQVGDRQHPDGHAGTEGGGQHQDAQPVGAGAAREFLGGVDADEDSHAGREATGEQL